jgi:hypothetical protein
MLHGFQEIDPAARNSGIRYDVCALPPTVVAVYDAIKIEAQDWLAQCSVPFFTRSQGIRRDRGSSGLPAVVIATE